MFVLKMINIAFIALFCFSKLLSESIERVELNQDTINGRLLVQNQSVIFDNINMINSAEKETNSQILLQTLFSYLGTDELNKLSNASSSKFIPINISKWRNKKQIFDMYFNNASSKCKSLNLTSNDCYMDCIYYNNILNLIPLIFSNNTNDTKLLEKYMILYSMSSAPYQWDNVGNPDMCLYSNGTYCYTPIMNIQQHACCVPGSCSNQDAVKVLKNNNWCYKMYVDYVNKSGNILPSEILTVCQPLKRNLNKSGPIIVIAIFCIFLLLIIISSIVKRYYFEYTNIDMIHINKNVFISMFNINDLWTSFVSVRPKNKSSLNFLDGFRVFSMSWVVLGHTWMHFDSTLSSNFPTDVGNRTEYKYKKAEFYSLFAEYAPYAVDSFFFLSGLLAAFSIYRQIKKYGNKAIYLCYQWIPLSYLMRFLRIAPVMMYAVSIQWQLLDNLPYGYHVTDRNSNNKFCTEVWYKLLFFYENLDEGLGPCMGQLWYMQCDMQMFLLLPWLLLLFVYNKIYGLLFTFVPILVCIIVRFRAAFYYHESANLMWPALPLVHLHDYRKVFPYVNPINRCSVYFIGVMTTFIFIIIDEKYPIPNKWKLNKNIYFALMLLSGFILLSLVFWPYQDIKDAPGHRWNLLSNEIYYALGRPFWGVGLAILSFAMYYINETNKQKSIIKQFLSFQIYQCLGKLTFLMYLIHLSIIWWWTNGLSFPLYFTNWNNILSIIGIWFIAAFISLILWFVIEKPLANIVNYFIGYITGGGRNKKDNKQMEHQQQLLDINKDDIKHEVVDEKAN